MPSQPRVSVAVSTYRRARFLPRLLRALEAQTLPPDEFEVVIVDNGSPDDTARVLEKLGTETSIRLGWHRLEQNRGPAPGRNAAWRVATAPVIAFTDDDCVPTPEWLEAGLRAFDRDTRIVVGRTRPNPDHADRLRKPFAMTITEDEGARFYNTCNIFYLREDLEAVGGFDEAFTTPGGEDTDLAWRVQEGGAGTSHAADALVHHDVHPGSFRGAARQAIRWTDIPRVVARHRRSRALLTWGVFWKPAHPRLLLAIAGFAVAPWQPLALAAGVPWVWFRVRRSPFCPGPRRRWLALPGGFIVDLLEVVTMIRGSLRHRTVVL